MSKTEELAGTLIRSLNTAENVGVHMYAAVQLVTHARALDASHRQLLEALEGLMIKSGALYGSPSADNPSEAFARTAIATAKELT